MPSEALSFQRFLAIDAHLLTSVAVSGSELLNVAFFLRYNFQVLTEGIIVVEYAVWCCSCWSGRICGSAADRAHRESSHQMLRGHVYDKTSNLGPCNFTCNDQMIVECVWGFSPWNCSKDTHCNSWITGHNSHMDLILWITILPLLCVSWHHMICIICLSPILFWTSYQRIKIFPF